MLPDSWKQIIILPGLLMVFGIFLFVATLQAYRNYGIRAKLWWSFYIPLALAFIVGAKGSLPIANDEMYRYVLIKYNQRAIFGAHLISMIGPIVLAVVAFVLSKRVLQPTSLYDDPTSGSEGGKRTFLQRFQRAK